MKFKIKKITVIVLTLGLIFISSTSSARGSHAFWIQKTFKNLNSIENYKATYALDFSTKEASPKAESIISDIHYKKPNDFHSFITHPKSLAGISAQFNNHAIALYNPHNKIALTIRGLKSPTVDSKLDQVEGMYYYNQKNYDQIFTPSINIAGQLSVGLDFIAKNKNAELLEANTYIDYHHSIFMQVGQTFKAGLQTNLVGTDIAFNQDSFHFPTIKIPSDTDLLAWDFNQASLTNKEFLQRINQKLHWPKDIDNSWKLTQRQFYQQTDSQTAAGYFYNEAFFVIALTQPDVAAREGDSSPPLSAPLLTIGAPVTIETVTGKETLYLSQYPEFSYIEFVRDNIRYSLIANIHPQSLIDMARGMLIEEK